MLDKQTSGTQSLEIYAYSDSDAVSSVFVTDTYSGVGNFNTNISSLMDYMTNNLSLSFTQIRMVSNESVEWAEMYLRQEANDTTPPNISNCNLYDENGSVKTEYTCLEELHFDCDVDDDLAVDTVTFTINGVNYTAEKHIEGNVTDHYFVEFNPEFNTSLFQYTLSDVYATDIAGNSNSWSDGIVGNYTCIFEDYINITHDPDTDVLGVTNTTASIYWTTNNPADSRLDYGLSPSNLSIFAYDGGFVTNHIFNLFSLTPNTTYYYQITSTFNPNQTEGVYNFTTSLSVCDENWILANTTCLTNDSRLIYYIDLNYCDTVVELPPDNGTYIACNYCSEDLVQTLGTCLWNGTAYVESVDYTDNNYFSCCVFTSQPSDCSILSYPYNQTTYQICTSLSEDFDVQLDDTVYFGFDVGDIEKVYGKVYINGSEEYSCVSYVKTPDGKLIQSNPAYKQATGSLISFVGTPEYDNREVFTTQNGLANVYWTKENLVVDGSIYVFGVECSSNSSHKISEKAVIVLYEGVNQPVTRWVWIKNNMMGIFMVGMIILLLGLAIFFIYRVIIK